MRLVNRLIRSILTRLDWWWVRLVGEHRVPSYPPRGLCLVCLERESH